MKVILLLSPLDYRNGMHEVICLLSSLDSIETWVHEVILFLLSLDYRNGLHEVILITSSLYWNKNAWSALLSSLIWNGSVWSALTSLIPGLKDIGTDALPVHGALQVVSGWCPLHHQFGVHVQHSMCLRYARLHTVHLDGLILTHGAGNVVGPVEVLSCFLVVALWGKSRQCESHVNMKEPLYMTTGKVFTQWITCEHEGIIVHDYRESLHSVNHMWTWTYHFTWLQGKPSWCKSHVNMNEPSKMTTRKLPCKAWWVAYSTWNYSLPTQLFSEEKRSLVGELL